MYKIKYFCKNLILVKVPKRFSHIFRNLKRNRILIIRKFKFNNIRAFIFILSTFIGVLGGLSAVILKNLAVITEELVYKNHFGNHNYWTIILPAIGILLTVIYIRFFAKSDLSHGVSKVLFAIAKNRSKIDIKKSYNSIISSSITVGFGGSVGLEAPIVYTGAAIGSSLAQKYHMNLKIRTLLIACGCSAAIGGIFKAPIAAIIFSLEVIMIDLSMWALIPILISATTGTLISYFLLGDKVSFSFAIFETFDKSKIIFYVVLGILCGLFSLYYTLISRKIEKYLSKFKNIYLKAGIGGLLLGIIIFIFPPLFGEGYVGLQYLMGNSPQNIMNNSVIYFFENKDLYLIVFLFFVLFLKVFASTLTTASGGIGGVFAPSLFTGGILGFIFAKIINISDYFKLSEHNFTLVGMAGVMSGIMHAPMTSIFLIADITGGYSLLFPLIVTSSIAYLVKYHFDKCSIYTFPLEEKKEMITHNKDKEALRRMDIENLIDNKFEIVSLLLPLKDFIKTVIPNSEKNIFIVENNHKEFIGIILVEDVMDVLLDKSKYEKLRIADIVKKTPKTISLDDIPEVIFKKFDSTKSWYLPVIENNKYIGMISKSKLLEQYRKLIVAFSED